MNKACLDAVRLLLAVAPVIFRKPTFALKGGTAINLFLQDMPRLSVDLDLVYADHLPGRDDALAGISSDLLALQNELNGLGFQCEMGSMFEGTEVKLFVQRDHTRVKIEVNHVFRGTILPVAPRPLVFSQVDDTPADTHAEWAGKLVAFPNIKRAFIAMTSRGGKFSGMMEAQSKTTSDLFGVNFKDMAAAAGELAGAGAPELGERVAEAARKAGESGTLDAQRENNQLTGETNRLISTLTGKVEKLGGGGMAAFG